MRPSRSPACSPLPHSLAKPGTLTIEQLSGYDGDGACLALHVTGAQGAYFGTVWMAGGESNQCKHLTGWYCATDGNPAGIDGITGADALFDADCRASGSSA